MEKDPNKIENWKQIKDILSDADKNKELYNDLADKEEAIHEKLSRLSQDYRDTINKESESGEKISEKDIYEANLSDIEKRFNNNSTEYKIFQALKRQGLKIFINPKTDVSYTDKYNIVRWLGPITEQTRYTIELWNDTTDDEIYMTKLIHEMWHSTLRYNTEHQESKVSNLLTILIKIRNEYNIPLTKLWNINRYNTKEKKCNEDCVEFIRMYVQNPIKFREYLESIIPAEHVINWIYSMVENFVQKLLNDNTET